MVVYDCDRTPANASNVVTIATRRPNSSPNSLSVSIGPQNFRFCEKCDPIVDRVFFTVPKFVTYSPESIPINVNRAAMVPNPQVFASNQLKSSHNRRP